MARATIIALVATIAALAVLSLGALADSGSASAGGIEWGDLDCSGSVTPVDSLKTLRKDAGLSVSQEPGCWLPGDTLMIGGSSRLWGDVDCASGINPVDSLKLLRFDAGLLSISAIAGSTACPDIGSLFAIDTPIPTPSPTPVGSITELKVSSASIASGDTVTISVTADATNLGSYRIDVQYDASLLAATACVSTFGTPLSCSIDTVAPDTVRMNGVDILGITGDDVVLGTITFITDSFGFGGTAALTVDPATQVLTDTSGQPLNITATNGAITIGLAPTPTPSPTATPTASPSPTATPGSLPSTGP